MATVYYDDDADLGLIQSRKIAVLGYGSQGHAHALSLHNSGCDVRVGLPGGSKSRAKAAEAGLTVGTPEEVCAWADLVMVLTPDTGQRKLYAQAIHRITDQAYWLPLSTYVTVYGLSKQLDFKAYPDEMPRFFWAKWK